MEYRPGMLTASTSATVPFGLMPPPPFLDSLTTTLPALPVRPLIWSAEDISQNRMYWLVLFCLMVWPMPGSPSSQAAGAGADPGARADARIVAKDAPEQPAGCQRR